MVKVLIVEDDPRLSRLLSLELEYEGYEVSVCHDGYQAIERGLGESWALIILDVMLPSLSGLEILRRFRKVNTSTPVIMLTARGEIPDKVSGLDLGANDYITKPFQTEELLARIRAQLRMTNSSDETIEQVLVLDDLEVNIEKHEVKRAKREITLTAKEFNLLVYLLENKERVLSREQIIEHVWGYDFLGDTNITDVYIRYLRKKIDHKEERALIHTVRGVGYVMKKG